MDAVTCQASACARRCSRIFAMAATWRCKTDTKLGDQSKRRSQPRAIGGIVEPAALPRWMGKRNHYRAAPELLSDAVLKLARTEELFDRHLSDQDQDAWLQDAALRDEPVRAVGDGTRWRSEVSGVARVAPGKAAQQGGDVGEPPELLRTFETRLSHPAVEHLARSTGEWPPRFALGPPGGLPAKQ